MTENERDILRTERVNQMLIALNQKAGLCNAMFKRFGNDAIEVIREEVTRDTIEWVKTVAKDHNERGIERDINGMHSFFWGPNEDEKMIYSYNDQKNQRTYSVSYCPLAEFAIKNDIVSWAKIFFCDNYKGISNTYNKNMDLEFHNCMMDGAKSCSFTFSINE